MSLRNIKISRKLPLIVVFAGVTLALGIGLASYWQARDATFTEIGNRLAAVQEARVSELSGYLESIEQDMRFTASNPMVWSAVRDYLETYSGAVVETSDFRRVLERHSGLNLTRFFEQWIHGSGYPHAGGCRAAHR